MIKYGIVFAAAAVVVLGMAYMQERGQREQIVIELVPSITALCRDGTYSTAEHKRGQCSGHGGVERWIIRESE